MGPPLRLLAIGESTVCGVGVERGDMTVTAETARALSRRTGRPVRWQALGLSGATAREGMAKLLPRVAPEPADLLIVAFGVKDTLMYRPPRAFADDVAALVDALRQRVGDAPAVIAGVAPVDLCPALPRPLRTILGWRARALQAAVEDLPRRLARVVVERITIAIGPELFAVDGFHPNEQAHKLWAAELAALALPLVERYSPWRKQAHQVTGDALRELAPSAQV